MAMKSMRVGRVLARRMASTTSATPAPSSAAQAIDKVATKGPILPAGNDPAAYHPIEHALKDTNRWKWITLGFGVPVLGYGILTSMNEHHHNPEPPAYDYLRRATRSPRFPWGDDDLIGTPHDREVWKAAKE